MIFFCTSDGSIINIETINFVKRGDSIHSVFFYGGNSLMVHEVDFQAMLEVCYNFKKPDPEIIESNLENKKKPVEKETKKIVIKKKTKK